MYIITVVVVVIRRNYVKNNENVSTSTPTHVYRLPGTSTQIELVYGINVQVLRINSNILKRFKKCVRKIFVEESKTKYIQVLGVLVLILQDRTVVLSLRT